MAAAAAPTSFIHILVILLGFSHLIYLNAVPISRTRTLHQLSETQNQDIDVLVSEKEMTEESLEEVFINGRMDLESNDYPGTGPNHSHTPKPPLATGSMN